MLGGMGIALGIFGNFLSAENAMKSGLEQRGAYYAQAGIVEERARYEAQDILREGRSVAASIQAESAAFGAELEGSPYLAMMQSLDRAKEDAEKTKRFAGQEAEYLRQTGRAAAKAGEREAMALILGGTGQAFSQQQGLSNVKRSQGV